MSLYLQHTASSCRWAIWKIEESTEQLLSLLPSPDLYRQALLRFRSEQRKREWLSVRVLLYVMRGCVDDIVYRSDGKPYLADQSAAISISHTNGYVAVLLGTPGQEAGIDIEQFGERVRRVVSRFMHPDEHPSCYQNTDLWSLLLHWSAKETLFKCLNAPEVSFSEHLFIPPFQVASSGIFYARESYTPLRRQFTVHYLLHHDFVLTWTVI